MQLTQYIAVCGICSRRKAVELIRAGKIIVNGTVMTQMGYRVQPHDQIMYDGILLVPEQKIYIMLHKPAGYVSTVSDEKKRPTVVALIALQQPLRLYPIGRLDAETTGLLLLTNDGHFTQRLAHPRYEVRKVYEVFLDRPLQEEDAAHLRKGIRLYDGISFVDELRYPQSMNRRRVHVVLHSGKNRIIRRLFGYLKYHLLSLHRIEYAGMSLKGLSVGHWRYLTASEIKKLKEQ